MPVSLSQLSAQSLPDAYEEGFIEFLDDHVILHEVEDASVFAEVRESSSITHDVRIDYFDESLNDLAGASCSCYESRTARRFCKHIIATILTVDHEYSENFDDEFEEDFGNNLGISFNSDDESDFGDGEINEFLNLLKQEQKPPQKSERKTDREIQNLVDRYAQTILEKSIPRPEITELARIETTLHYNPSYYYSEIYLTFKIGSKKLYVVKDIDEFAFGLRNREVLEMGKKYSILLDREAFEPEFHPLLDFITKHQPGHHRFERYSRSKKNLYLDTTDLAELFDACTDTRLSIRIGESGRLKSYMVRQKIPPLSLSLEEHAPGFSLTCTPFDGIIAGRDYLGILKGSILYHCDVDYANACNDLLYSFVSKTEHYIEAKDIKAFTSSVVSGVKDFIDIDIVPAALKYSPDPLEVKIYFDLRSSGEVEAHMTFTYGDKSFDAFEPKYADQSFDLASEIKVEQALMTYMGNQLDEPGTLVQDDEDALFTLLADGFDELQKYAEIYISDELKKYRVRPPVQASVGVRIEANLLAVDIQVEDLDFEELVAVLNTYKRAKRYHRLSDGSFLDLQDEAVTQIAELREVLSLSDADLEKGQLSFDPNRSLYLDAMLKRSEGLRYTRDASFKDIVRRMNDIEDAEFVVPESLEGTLRSYQNTGYQWLRTLGYLGFGGILADDMGLGKTLQVLTLLVSLKKEGGYSKAGDQIDGRNHGAREGKNSKGSHNKEISPSAKSGWNTEGSHGTSIVVCPASLVYNWQAEAARFAPELSVSAVAGAADQRAKTLAEAKRTDLLITSYDLLKRDMEYYENLSFEYIILDEAHYIKNQNTQSAKAVKVLQGTHRLALTGTPIENSLAELWSVFDFLMPGYLRGYTRFRQDYETPITKNKNEAAQERLRALVRPFILQRLKSEVLRELPAKMEQIQFATMEGEQRKIYAATLAQTKKELAAKLENAGAGQSRILVLSALTRLRQICCDPSLVYDNYTEKSAKLEMCLDLIRSCVDGGHRILLFSQFTSMLAILKERLAKEDIPYYLLQGSTPKIERLKLVDQFNENDVPVFLISLKAGGTGLNLTGADMVIHYDPWWNLSAQNQATDRTHRIGQTNRVQVYKLIMKDTIEERIVELQNAKAELANSIIQEGGSVFDTLSSEELLSLLEG